MHPDQAAIFSGATVSTATRIHISGICGTGTGALASLLQAMGLTVRGSDDQVYPPMSTFLEERGIEILQGYRAEHLQDRPDWVVIGNALSRDNPEAVAARELGLAATSFPAALERWILPEKVPVVVVGTHGKTTTTSLTTHLLREADLDPGWLIGGLPRGLDGPAHLGNGAPFVIEGDEYDTAYFDKGAKFLHYLPQVAILTSVEFDHADIFRDLDHVRATFAAFLALLPPHGRLIACHDDAEVRSLVEEHPPACPVIWYGLEPGAAVRAMAPRWNGAATCFDLSLPGEATRSYRLPASGDHNLVNALGALAACHFLGASPEALKEGLARFAGIRRRQEVVAEVRGITLIDDFAHHPTAVAATLKGLRTRFPGRRLWGVFEFRSNSAIRRTFQDGYCQALCHADRVALPPILRNHRLPADQLLEPTEIAADLTANGTLAQATADLDDLLAHLSYQLREGDVVAIMSSGSFGGLIPSLRARLAGSPDEKVLEVMNRDG